MKSIKVLVAAIALAAAASAAQAALTDISTTPLASSSSSLVKPNVLFELDTSGSMAWTHAPDESQPWADNVGYKTSQCNSIYYNPNILYPPPRAADGSSYPNASFSGAWINGFNTGAGTVNLGTSFYAYDNTSSFGAGTDTAQPAYYYVYLGSQTPNGLAYQNSGSTFYKECNAAESPGPTSTITFSGSSNTSVTSITVSGTNIMSGSTTPSTSPSTVATNTAALITASGFTATASGGTVTISGPLTAAGVTPVLTASPPIPNATITFSGSTNTSVTSIKVNGLELMTGPSAASTSSATVAANVASRISLNGFSATVSGSVVTIYGPFSAAGFTPVVTKVGPQSATITFSGSGSNSVTGITVNGTNIMSSGTSTQTTTSGLASATAAQITLNGFSATASGSVVTITGPPSAAGFGPVVSTAAGASTATITVAGSGSTSMTSIKVNGVTISTGASIASTNKNTVASNIAAKIGSGGFTATASSNVVTITGPLSALGFTPVITQSGGMSLTPSAFVAANMGIATTNFANSGSAMTTTITAFPPPGTMTATITPFSAFKKVLVNATSGIGGTDERQNFANWFSYYRIRILMMKSGASRAFVGIGSGYRVGFMTIYATPSSSTTDPAFLAVNDFTATQKTNWFSRLFGTAASGGTPLRQSLSTGARYMSGKVGPDPLQYSCQQQFIILTTDGYWNAGSANGVQLNGSSSVGNQDNNIATSPRPIYDGNLAASSNTLADVAAYYYNTDLRTTSCNTGVSGADVCTDNVPVSGLDNAPWQHITLFTLGLGVNGVLNYATDYLTGGSADYNAIVAGSKDWPSPTGDTLTTIDDLWHAAVNGHGQYFSARNPDLLVTGLQQALAGISAREAAGAAAATSNLEPVAGDNFAFVANYRTQKWDGDVEARQIDLVSGAISNTPIWSAQSLLDTATSDTSDSRTIFTFLGGVKVPFIAASFSASQLTNWFTPGTAPALSQFAGWTAAQSAQATPAAMINYLRGQYGNEERASNPSVNQLFRGREHVLGDVVNGKPVYVKNPPFQYTENSYQTFKNGLNRNGAVYVAANDGMLHSFDATTGVENWAYIPSFVLSSLKQLADDTYPNNHRYFVDGSPTVSDVWTGSAWRTILVAGLNGGGKGYYCLDITDPANPNVLWEFSDANLGFSYGNPVVGKLQSGTWAVFFTSGYNNGDGMGRLYAVNAYTGTPIAGFPSLANGVGTAATPSGLSKISAWVDNGLADNTVLRIYGGDTFGNLWRFDVNNILPPSGIDAFKLAFFQVGTYLQPVTTKPELGLVSNHPVIYVGTGKYLGASDLSDLGQQSLYAIRDDLSAVAIGNPRTNSTCPFVQQTLTVINANTRSTSTTPVDFATKCGWYLDFNPGNQTPGERINVDMKLQLGVLGVATNIPESSVCTLGGSSFLYFFDYGTGQFVSTSIGGVVGQRISSSIAVGLNTYRLPDGRVVTTVTTSDDKHPVFGNPNNPLIGSIGKRVLWRELLQ